MVYFVRFKIEEKKMSNETIDIPSKGLWERAKTIFLSTLQNGDDKSQAERYFSLITSVSAENSTFCVLTSSAFAADLLKNNYSEKLKSCLILAGADPSVEILFNHDTNSKPAIITPVETPKPVALSNAPAMAPTMASNQFISTLPLNDNYTFDEFVIGPSNSWAHAAAKGVVEHPGEFGYNPLFIHGGTGLGKTHLMQAIGNELKKRNPNLAVCYLTAETFLNEYVNSLQNKGIHTFREKYRTIDVLLVDDVQFLQKGKQCQEEFFNTFNTLTGSRKQIVMTSDVAPKNLPAIEERLISRFEGGLVQEIESPSYETRLAILKKKAEGMTPSIPENALQFIADHIKSHVRAMEGALAKVKVSISLNPTDTMTTDMLARLLKDFIEKEKTVRKLTVEEIQAAVAKKFNVSIEQILSMERTQSLVTPRQLAMYIARKYSSKSLMEIALHFKKSHATIVHGVRTIEKRIDVEKELKLTLEEIVSEFGLLPNDKVD